MSADKGTPKVARAVIHRGAKFDFERATFPGNDGRVLTREYIRHPGAVVILPVLGDGTAGGGGRAQIVFIRNYRVSIGRTLWELPAGTRDPGEEPETTAARELEEETGYSAATLTPLGRFHTSPGLSDEMIFAFAATGLTHVGQRLEPDEALTVHPVEVGEAWGMIDRGELIDAKSIAGMLLGVRRGVLSYAG